jgi:hypothetical protein
MACYMMKSKSVSKGQDISMRLMFRFLRENTYQEDDCN